MVISEKRTKILPEKKTEVFHDIQGARLNASACGEGSLNRNSTSTCSSSPTTGSDSAKQCDNKEKTKEKSKESEKSKKSEWNQAPLNNGIQCKDQFENLQIGLFTSNPAFDTNIS